MLQKTPMPLLGAAGLLVALVAVGLPQPYAASEEEDWDARARKTWGGNCSGCHAVPDAAYETDRAFLAQITETS